MALAYALNVGNTSYKLVYSSCTAGDVVIPSTYNGLPVTAIGRYAFENCLTITSVTILNSVTSIEEGAFADCTNLTSVTIGNSVTSIPLSVFEGCTSLTSITIPKSVTIIGDTVFAFCSSLIRVNFLGNAPTLGSFVFKNTNVNLKVYRYSTKSGWSSTFGGKDVLLIDQPSKGLKTFGFSGLSSGQASIKNQNLSLLKPQKLYTYKSSDIKYLINVFQILVEGYTLNVYEGGINGQTKSFLSSGEGWYDPITYQNFDPYIIPVNSVITFTGPNDIVVGNGAIIQKYYGGKASLFKT
jgi:hypothetical protein